MNCSPPSLRSWLILFGALLALGAWTLTPTRAQEEIDKTEPDENESAPTGPLSAQIKARLRVVETTPQLDAVDIYWRLGGEGLGGESKGGRFERADTPEPDIDKMLQETPRGERHIAVGEWTGWVTLPQLLKGGGGGFPTITVQPVTRSKSDPIKITSMSVEFEFARGKKTIKKFTEPSPKGNTVGCRVPGKLLASEASFPEFVKQLQGLSTYVKQRRELLEQLFPEPSPLPQKFGVLGHLGGYGEGAGYGIRHCNPQIVADETKAMHLLGMNGLKGTGGLKRPALKGIGEDLFGTIWSGSTGIHLGFDPANSVEGCPFNPTSPQLVAEGFQKSLDSHKAIGSPHTWAQAGDEIGVALKEHMNNCPQCHVAFRQMLKENGVTPEQVGASSWDDVLPYPMFVIEENPDGTEATKRVKKGGGKSKEVPKVVRGPTPNTPEDKLRSYYTYRFMTYATGHLYAGPAKLYKQHNIPFFAMLAPTPSWSGSSLDWHEFFDKGENMSVVWETSNRDPRVWQWESYLGDMARNIAARHDGSMGCLVKPHRGAPIQRMLSVVSRGVTSFEWYTYGPDYFKGDCWSQSPGILESVGRAGRFLGKAEPWLYGAKFAQQPEVAMVTPRSSQVWAGGQPVGGTTFQDFKWVYLALTHQHIPVDILSEQQLAEEGALKKYKVLYVVGQNLDRDAAARVSQWVHDGGALWTDTLGLMADEANQPAAISTELLGLSERKYEGWGQCPGYGATGLGALVEQDIPPAATFEWTPAGASSPKQIQARVGREPLTPVDGKVIAKFADGAPAVTRRTVGKGTVEVAGFWAGVTYSAKVRRGDFDMQTDYDPDLRALIAGLALDRGVYRPVTPANAQVEAVYLDNQGKRSIALINWSYHRPKDTAGKRNFQSVEQLDIALPGVGPIKSARSIVHGDLPLKKTGDVVHVTLPKIDEVDLIVVE